MTLLLLLFMIVTVLAMSLIYDLCHKNSTYNYSSKVSTSVSALELTAIKNDLSVNMILTNCVISLPGPSPIASEKVSVLPDRIPFLRSRERVLLLYYGNFSLAALSGRADARRRRMEETLGYASSDGMAKRALKQILSS